MPCTNARWRLAQKSRHSKARRRPHGPVRLLVTASNQACETTRRRRKAPRRETEQGLSSVANYGSPRRQTAPTPTHGCGCPWAEPIFHVGDWVEVMRLDGNDVRYGDIVACWAQLSAAERCGFETWYSTESTSALNRLGSDRDGSSVGVAGQRTRTDNRDALP